MPKFFLKVRIAFKTLARAFLHEYYPAMFALIFVSILFLLQWLFEYEQFYEVIIKNNAGLNITEKFDFLFESLVSLFKYLDDLTPISLVLIAFFQASIVIIWIRTKEIKKAKKVSSVALGIGLLGAGCVACASSLLAVILSSFGSAVSVALVQTIGDILLVVAVLLSAKAFIDLGVITAGYFNEQT